jgi:hypothetical protein
MEKIKVDKIYSLDLGSLSPIEVKVLKILNENQVLVEYLYSWSGRTEIFPKEYFEINGLTI